MSANKFTAAFTRDAVTEADLYKQRLFSLPHPVFLMASNALKDGNESGAGPEYAALVASCRTRLAEEGMFDLPGFLRPEVTRAAADATKPAMATEDFRHARSHNIYFRDTVEGLAPDHPALAKVETINHTLTADQLVGNPVIAL